MKKIALAGLAGMLLVSASVNAMSISGQAGKEYTNIGVGFGTESTGLALSGNWTNPACSYIETALSFSATTLSSSWL